MLTKQLEGVRKGEMYIFLAGENVGKSKLFSNKGNEMTKFDFHAALNGASIETLRGIKAKILSVNTALEKPLIVQVGDQVYNYTVEGKRSRSANVIPLDLRMAQAPKEVSDVRYVNVSYYEEDDLAEQYKLGVYIHKTRKEAFDAAKDAKNVRIVAMPVPVSFKTDEIHLYTKYGDALILPEKAARNLMQKTNL